MSATNSAADTKPEAAKAPLVTSEVALTTDLAVAAAPAAAPAASAGGDDDFDDLDDMLDDFASEVLSKPPGSTVDATLKDPGTIDGSEAGFNQLAAIADMLKDMKIDDPETQAEFAKLVDQFDTKYKDDVEAAELNPNNFEHVMAETMERLKKLGENIDEKIKNDPLGGNPEDMLTQLLAGLGDKDMDMNKLLVDMLEQLSLKEVLYEPIKDLHDKFPAYLEEHKATLNPDLYVVYEKQHKLTQEIVAIFDSPTYNDADTQQREQVNSLLEQLQDLGQPPKELVGDAEDFPGFGGMGGPKDDLNFNPDELPADVAKQMEEGCKQQ